MQGDYSGDTEVIALCPTRGNPERALGMVRSFYETVRRTHTEVILVVDADDPKLEAYRAIPGQVAHDLVGMGITRPDPVRVMIVEGGSLTKATNEAVERLWDEDVIIGHVGDDHRFRTPGWDTRIRDALLERPGVAYARDGHSSCWASAWWTNAVVPRTLGWLAVPGSHHLTIDDIFMDIGGATRLTFLDDVLIEHVWDNRSTVFYETTRRAQENANMARYRAEQFQADVDKLRAVLGLPPETFDMRFPPGEVFRRNYKLLHHYNLGRDEPQPLPEELEAIAGRPLRPGGPGWIRARREWLRVSRAAAGVG